MPYTKEDVKNYLIDCIGYSEEDLQGLSLKDLMNEVDRPTELKAFTF